MKIEPLHLYLTYIITLFIIIGTLATTGVIK